MLENLTNLLNFTAIRPLVYLVEKPIGFTSYTIVDIFKHTTHDKVGHAGTLDPLACGEMLILIGPATKLANIYLQKDKHYQTSILIGAHTESADLETPLTIDHTKNNQIENITKDSIINALKRLQGIQEFTVSKFSAIKNKGQPLYKYKNRGKPIQLKSKKMNLFDFNIRELHYITSKDLSNILLNKLKEIQRSKELYNAITQKLSIPIRAKQMQLFDKLIDIIQANNDIATKENHTQLILLNIDLHVSSGTYIRTLVEYLGKLMNIPATTIDIIRHNSYN